jgi:hypothetical protein
LASIHLNIANPIPLSSVTRTGSQTLEETATELSDPTNLDKSLRAFADIDQNIRQCTCKQSGVNSWMFLLLMMKYQPA